MNIAECAANLLRYFSPEERSIPDSVTYPGRNAEVLTAINGAFQELFGLFEFLGHRSLSSDIPQGRQDGFALSNDPGEVHRHNGVRRGSLQVEIGGRRRLPLRQR